MSCIVCFNERCTCLLKSNDQCPRCHEIEPYDHELEWWKCACIRNEEKPKKLNMKELDEMLDRELPNFGRNNG